MQFSHKTLPDGRNFLYAWFSAMFTRIDLIMITNACEHDLEKIAKRVENEVVRIETFANKFNSESELSLINRLAGLQDVTISDEMMQILQECKNYHQKTIGYFDITAGSETYVLREKYFLNKEKSTVKFAVANVKLDLSGFIKGYALRKVIEILNNEEITDALINIGNSSVGAKGNHPFGEGWKIQVPDTQTECVLRNECLTTSGNRPDTKWPVVMPDSRLPGTKSSAASVITTDGAEGEALSTAIYLAKENEVGLILKKFNARML